MIRRHDCVAIVTQMTRDHSLTSTEETEASWCQWQQWTVVPHDSCLCDCYLGTSGLPQYHTTTTWHHLHHHHHQQCKTCSMLLLKEHRCITMSVQVNRSCHHLWATKVELIKDERPTKHIKGHIGDGFYGSNDPTNSVKELKEDRVLRIRFQTHQVHPLCYNNTTHMQYDRINTKQTQT